MLDNNKLDSVHIGFKLRGTQNHQDINKRLFHGKTTVNNDSEVYLLDPCAHVITICGRKHG